MISQITNCWNKYLALIPDNCKDIYFTEEYAKLYENIEQNEKALCYVYQDNEFLLLMPFIRKNIDEDFFDFETPYGYGGPITNCSDKKWISIALEEMYCMFNKKNYIAGFIRYHPLLNNVDYCNNVVNSYFDRYTVFLDLNKSLDEIWTDQITSKNRNIIRKAEKSDLFFYADFEFDSLNEFMQIYNSTMQNVNADNFYFFEKNYYSEFKKKIRNNSFLAIVKKEEQVISTAIIMYNSFYGHYHLSGSSLLYRNFGINNFLLWNVAKTLKEKNIRYFHLGGGTNSDTKNSLFAFKKSFNPNCSKFYIGKAIFNQNKYNQLCTDWEEKNPDKTEIYKNHLLKYRN